MRLRVVLAFGVLLVIVGLLVGCSPKPDYTARFVRYVQQGGERVALVTPNEQTDEQQTAFTGIPHLKAGELVLIHYTGRSWDSPQGTPEREIVARATRR